MIRVVLADDHPVIREGILWLLKKEPDIDVIGEAGTGREAVKLAQRLRPDILVADMVMEDMSGIEVTKRVMECSPEVSVVILSAFGTDAYVQGAFRAGAKAYALKKSSRRELVLAIREAAAGRRYVSRELSERALDFFLENPHAGVSDALSAREREVLSMVTRGLTSAEIAAALVISPRTVEFHRANIMHKLGVHSHIELLRCCASAGLMPPDDEALPAPVFTRPTALNHDGRRRHQSAVTR